MSENVPDETDADKATSLLVAALSSLPPEERERSLQRAENLLHNVRWQHDFERGASVEVQKARWWEKWLRGVARYLEEDPSNHTFWSAELAKFEALQPKRSAVELQRHIARLTDFYAEHGADHRSKPGTPGEEEKTSATLASELAVGDRRPRRRWPRCLPPTCVSPQTG